MVHEVQQIRIIDDSGLLGLVDTQSYSAFVSEDWSYDDIISHFEQQMQQKTILVWDCGDGGDDYSIEVRRGFTTEAGFREVTGGITSSGDGLYVASYTALTMAAQFDDETLPSKHEADAHVTLEPGPYRLRIVQRFDPTQIGKREGPDFIVELEQGECEPLSAVAWLQTSPA